MEKSEKNEKNKMWKMKNEMQMRQSEHNNKMDIRDVQPCVLQQLEESGAMRCIIYNTSHRAASRKKNAVTKNVVTDHPMYLYLIST